MAFGTQNKAEEVKAPDKSVLVELGEGNYQLGQLVLNKNAGSISFPARVNLDEGALEYVLVTPQGSVHESVLVTDVQPRDIHVGMLLLGARGTAAVHGNRPDSAGQINEEFLKHTPKPTGDPVELTVKWRSEERERSVRLEDWILNLDTGKPMERGIWIYNGSELVGETFLAQAVGSIVSLVSNPSALVNNPRPGSDNDKIWVSNKGMVPKLGTLVEVTMTLGRARSDSSKTLLLEKK